MGDVDPASTELDPLLASQQIREDYLRYIQTAFPLKDARLSGSFRRLIRRPDFLVKGPYLEGTPPLRTSLSTRDLVRDGTLCEGFEGLDGPGFPDLGYPINRPLYAHQEHAVRKVSSGRNVIVASGTGSGKTEAFLIPIIDYLLREREAGTLGAHGVRALLLYPMNALANDQLKRLRRLLASTPDITFGRYTGQTLHRRDRAEEDFREVFPQEPRVDNELICRDDIREAPPHILLTNYAMLEYLLLRPADTTLFDGSTGEHWAFIVVDEAHTYSGAAGMEVGMLLRRLKDRVVQSQPGAIRCVATSATLGGGKGDFAELVGFATQLFGERFDWEENDLDRQDVVEAEHEDPASLGRAWGRPSSGLYPALKASRDDIDSMVSAARANGVPEATVEGALALAASPRAFLHALLRGDERVLELRTVLRERPLQVESACQIVFGERSDESCAALVALVALCARARVDEDSSPLIPARYHLFARALEGGMVTFPAQAGPRLHLETVDRVEEEGEQSQAFEIATCTRCGHVFLTGIICDDWASLRPGESLGRRLRPLPNRWSDLAEKGKKVFLTWGDASDCRADEDDVVLADGEVGPQGSAPWVLCTRCGALEPGTEGPDCGCPSQRRIRVHEASMKEGRLATCPSCGTQTPYEDVANRLLTGQDAPPAVLATSLYQLLPGDRDSHLAGQGRKLLIFSDSRQDAAYFAPYLETTHKALLHRRLILQALELHRQDYGPDPARPHGLARTYLRQLTHDHLIFEGPSDPALEHNERCTWVFQELLSFERRIGLEGSGLLSVRYTKPRGWEPPPVLCSEPWGTGPDEVWPLVEVLLNTLRFSGALCVEPADITGEEFAPRNRAVYYREIGGDTARAVTILGWLPRRDVRSHVTNRRFDYLARLVERRTGRSADPDLVVEALRAIWRSLTSDSSGLLQSVTLRNLGVVHHIDHGHVELRHGGSEAVEWFQCSLCRALSVVAIEGVCPTMGCPGTMKRFRPSSGLADHHYRELYRRMNPTPMRVREHTAQWAARKAAEIQQRFVDGEVNVLSCSTTFELGVDVGQLQAVLMRNMPPSTARYVQRAGRAGRRTESAAFSLTYAQRRPHDLTHFASPEQFIAGRIKPPAVEIWNAKIVRRHLHAVALADYFRQHPDTFANVDAFFATDTAGRGGPEVLAAILREEPAELLHALKRLVPDDAGLLAELDLDHWGWVSELLGDPKGVLTVAAAEVNSDLAEYQRLEQEASADGKHSLAALYQRHGNRVRRRQLLGFLASRNVLPKYGFPVDLVELHLKPGRDVAHELELQRDLKIAIAEYAPGGQVVAGHLVWESSGLRRLPHREPEEFSYVICASCGRFHRSITSEGLPQQCEACRAPFRGAGCRSGTLVVPVFGFFSSKDPRSVGRARPKRLYSSRVYFSDYTGEGPGANFASLELGNAESPFRLLFRHSKQGKLAVVNGGIAGRGFWLCQWCGYGEPVAIRSSGRRTREHLNAYGRSCTGPRHMRHLGHEFLTDVLELRFSGPPVREDRDGFWWSMTYALLEGASAALGIERDDVDGCLYPYGAGEQAPAIILYDCIPGGAGHVRRVAEHLSGVLEEARDRVVACPHCDEDASCYACLKSYSNQFCQHLLRRGPVGRFLDQFLGTKRMA